MDFSSTLSPRKLLLLPASSFAYFRRWTPDGRAETRVRDPAPTGPYFASDAHKQLTLVLALPATRRSSLYGTRSLAWRRKTSLEAKRATCTDTSPPNFGGTTAKLAETCTRRLCKIRFVRQLLSRLGRMQPAQRFMRTAKMGGNAFLLDVGRGGQRSLIPTVAVARQSPVDQRQRKNNNTSLAWLGTMASPAPVDPHSLTQAFDLISVRKPFRLLERLEPSRTPEEIVPHSWTSRGDACKNTWIGSQAHSRPFSAITMLWAHVVLTTLTSNYCRERRRSPAPQRIIIACQEIGSPELTFGALGQGLQPWPLVMLIGPDHQTGANHPVVIQPCRLD
ncbi:hypothetical protein BIW11_02539 [Tropilaelaps mercedesae]|uniref:Uncharacterized protein n=1 Tax=Tropilaelaps mercedesae TaxID=418985 RepID=A0A1V9Y1D2_9ACAR|nr:hypothetical protein BIW11_02539 [Tropilaelaps mercedesae]